MSDFDFIDYDKISNKSDAFITSDELNSYFQYIPSTKATSYNIKKELHLNNVCFFRGLDLLDKNKLN